ILSPLEGGRIINRRLRYSWGIFTRPEKLVKSSSLRPFSGRTGLDFYNSVGNGNIRCKETVDLLDESGSQKKG
ncbi:MAG: hypothetical protein LUQ60_05245, partial [Methanomicrobiales archaeon]|nr:hypothetical protein [Methanomicrobiales archaeon]